MSFNDQAKSISGRGGRKFIFADGTRYKHMSGASAILFRLLPAFNPGDPNPGTSWLPCLDPNGNLTDWGAVLKIVRFVGHGQGGAGSRQDLLSLKTFETQGNQVFCPLDAVYSTIQQDIQTWGYLITDVGDRKSKTGQRAAFGRAASHLICNVFDINQTQLGTQLGVFTSGASSKLIDRKDGLIYQPNASSNVSEQIKQDYIYAYANGDITHPATAPLLICEKGEANGDFSAYKISIAVGPDRMVLRRPIDQLVMSQRYDLTKLETFINVPTQDDLVQSLIQLLNGRSPLGYHEHALLKMALPQFQIPDPPMAPGAMPSVQGWSTPAPQSAGFPVSPGQSIPAGYNGGQLTAQQPGPAFGIPTPSAPVQAPAPMPTAVPTAQPVFQFSQTPNTFVAPTQSTQPAGKSAELGGVTQNASQPMGQPQQGVPAVTPGDPVAPFDQAAFLARIRGGAAQAAAAQGAQ